MCFATFCGWAEAWGAEKREGDGNILSGSPMGAGRVGLA